MVNSRAGFNDAPTPKNAPSGTKALFPIPLFCFAGALVTFAVLAGPFQPQIEAIPQGYIHGLSLLAYVFSLLALWSAGITALSAPGLFLFGTLLFNSGRSIAYFLPHPLPPLGQGLAEGDESRAVLAVTLVVFCMSLGLVFGKRFFAQGPKAIDTSANATRIAGIAILALAALPAFISLRSSLDTALSHGYSGLYSSEVSTGIDGSWRVLSSFFIPSCLFVLAGSRTTATWRRTSLGLIVSYSLVLFAVGYRGWSALPLVAACWVWHHSVRPISRRFVVAASAVLLLVVFPLVREFRQSTGRERTEASSIVNKYRSLDSPIRSILLEMGGTANTIAYTEKLVPRERDFELGNSYLFSALTIFPNLFWSLHPTVERGTPSRWLVATINPAEAAIGGGMGYSFIAEAYLNFGTFGYVLAGFVLGSALLGIEYTAAGNVRRVALVGAFLSFFLFYVRDDSTGWVRGLAWFSLSPYLLSLLLTRLSKPRWPAMPLKLAR